MSLGRGSPWPKQRPGGPDMVTLQDNLPDHIGIQRYKAANKSPSLRELLPRNRVRMFDPSSVGGVDRHMVHFADTLHLQSGGKLEGFTQAYETYGVLNEDRSNVIWICHALSGDS